PARGPAGDALLPRRLDDPARLRGRRPHHGAALRRAGHPDRGPAVLLLPRDGDPARGRAQRDHPGTLAGTAAPPRATAGQAADGRPVVALESTLLAHGLPRPDNRKAADDVEAAVRRGGAVPATIAVLDGVPHVGLTAEEVDRVCGDPGLAKLSVRDLPVAAALGLSGGTTVSST